MSIRSELASDRRLPPLRRSFALAVLFAALSGTVLGLSGEPFRMGGLAFAYAPFSMAALLVVEPRGVWRPALLGLVAGFVTNAIALYWAVGLMMDFAAFSLAQALPTALLLFVAQAAPFAVATLIVSSFGAAGRRHLWWSLPAALVVAFSFTPALFPWRPSAPLILWPAYAQLAEIGGAPLLDFLAALVGCSSLELVLRWVAGRTRGDDRLSASPSAIDAPPPTHRGAHSSSARLARFALIPLLALALPAFYGAFRLPRVEAERAAAPKLRVGVVQPNVGILDKHNPRKWHEQLVQLRIATRQLQEQGAELVVWPESAYPYAIARGQDWDFDGPQSVRGGHFDVPVLFGALTVGGPCEAYNSVVAMDGSGAIRGVTDKVKLLAFGETVPLWHWLPPLQERFACPGLVPGDAPDWLELAGVRVGVLNCYEDVLGEFAREVSRGEPQLLVNATNDAWFGDTTEPHLHQMVARMRSIETRRDLLRSVNTGVSSWIAATGVELYRTETFERRAFIAEVALLQGTTAWVVLGDLSAEAALGALLALGWLALRRRA